MEVYLQYFAEKHAQYGEMIAQHIALCAEAVAIAFLIAFPLGILTLYVPVLYKICNALFQGLRIIPSLAVLVFLIPLIGIGTTPALVALVLLAVPSILIQTSLGFQSLDEKLQEAAAGMGMNERQLFFKVRLPLVAPYTLTGLKTATSEVMASVTLAAYIGAGGLGVLITTGISMMKTEYLVIGGGTVALLTLLANLFWDLAERVLLRHRGARRQKTG